MLSIITAKGPFLEYEIEGQLGAADLQAYYATLQQHYHGYGRVDLIVRARTFKGYSSWKSVALFLRHEPELLWKVKRYTLFANQAWLVKSVRLVGSLCWWIEVKAALLVSENAGRAESTTGEVK